MKSCKFLLVLIMALLVLPFSVFADGEEVTVAEESKEVNVYLFRGEGCPHCQEAEEWFASIEEEYGQYFEVIDYETWYNEENANLMKKVAEARGETVEGVPYIVIGNKSWFGFAKDYQDEILAQIKSEFEVNVADRYDIVKSISNGSEIPKNKEEEKSSNDALSLFIILAVTGAVGYGIYRARKSQ